jgi:hypothetical protein
MNRQCITISISQCRPAVAATCLRSCFLSIPCCLISHRLASKTSLNSATTLQQSFSGGLISFQHNNPTRRMFDRGAARIWAFNVLMWLALGTTRFVLLPKGGMRSRSAMPDSKHRPWLDGNSSSWRHCLPSWDSMLAPFRAGPWEPHEKMGIQLERRCLQLSGSLTHAWKRAKNLRPGSVNTLISRGLGSCQQ